MHTPDFEQAMQALQQDEGLYQLLQNAAEQRPEAIFAIVGQQNITLAEFQARVDQLAARLNASGLQTGDRIAVLLGNSLDYAALIFAIARLRLVWVAVNIKQNEAGMRHMLESCEPKLIISDRRFELIITDCKTNQCPLIWYRPDEDETLTGIFENLPQTGSDDLPSPGKTGERFCIKFTSGTTGPPKGAVLAQKSVIAAGWASLLVSKVKAGDRMLLWEPLYHLSGCQMLILPLLQQIELVMTARFSASTFWQTAREYGITHLHYLGGVAQILLKQPEKSKQDREHPVRTAWGAGCSAQVWQAFVQRFGVEMVECYGLTESAGFATACFTGKPGSIGKVLPWMDVAVFDENDRELGPGERGEIRLKEKIPDVFFKEYFNNPEATAERWRDGWFCTGDGGRIDDDGELFYGQRLSDSIRHKGENISAWEIESVVLTHPNVEECAVIGVAGELGEQDIKLFVKPRLGDMDLAELERFCRERLARHQLPRYFESINEFPKTPTERIAKHLLLKK